MPWRAALPNVGLTEMDLIQTAIAFVVALGSLIFFHELGHYTVARLCKVKVLRFSLGMGRVLLSRRFGVDQTEWVISAFPLGGYVKMLDARDPEQAGLMPAEPGREFTSQPVWKRFAIVAAGPLANFLLAIILLSVLFMVGVPEPVARVRAPAPTSLAYQIGLRGHDRITAVNGKSLQLWSELRWELLQCAVEKRPAELTVQTSGTDQPVQILLPLANLTVEDLQTDFLSKLGLSMALSPARLGKVQANSPASRAGLLSGDLVEEIDGQMIADSLDLIRLVRASPNKALDIRVRRADRKLDFMVTPQAEQTPAGTIGQLKVEVSSRPEMLDRRDSLLEAIPKAVGRTWDTSLLTLRMIGKMLIGEASVKNITGPLTIADYAGQTAKAGWTSYLSFLAFVSISLGIMNLLPIPVLDGGHLLYYSLEVLTGRPVPTRIWELSQRAGLVMLMVLMVIAFFNDIVKLLPA